MSSPFDQIVVGSDVELGEEAALSLLETLDHVLNRGLVIAGEITISVADVDLIFVGLNVLVSSVEKANEVLRERKTTSTEATG
ncbi:MAG TPA: gas vesicle protein GvpJ [Pyrinomonadaceae bacterium]|jgi:3-oxoacyl-(acyl-carrier-protein) synthase|nr:gas vesicle protein GvpJ [Pyrinomonadaceae bacterium]